MKLINQIIHIPIFNCNIHLYVGDRNNIKDELKKEFGDEEGLSLFKEIKADDGIDGSSIMLPNGYKIIWLNKYPDNLSNKGVLVHEIFHMAIDIMLSRDIQLENSTEELCAYLIEYLYEEIFKLIENNNETN